MRVLGSCLNIQIVLISQSYSLDNIKQMTNKPLSPPKNVADL